MNFNDILSPYVSAPARTAYRKIKRYQAVLPRRQALRDLAQLRYIFDNRYCGKEHWERQGISFEQCYAQIQALVEAREEIRVGDFCRSIHAAFDIGIVDNHLCVLSPDTGRLHFSKVYAAFFADILAEKTGDAFTIVQSEDPQVKTGGAIADADCLFPTLSPPGRQFYLVGCRSWDMIDGMPLQVGAAALTVGVHRCGAAVKRESRDVCMERLQTGGIDIVRSNCCDYVHPLTKQADIVGVGRAYAGTQRLIWDNLSNEGGYSAIARDFIQGLNGYACCEEYCAKLTSPITRSRPCKRKWLLYDAQPCQPERGSYDGTLYFLMNSGTASSGETSVLYAKSLRKAVFIGENSMGCNTFGNTASYQLRHSGIVLRVPNIINLCRDPDDCAEGKGFTPDFWVDSPDVRAEVIRWLRNPESYMPGAGTRRAISSAGTDRAGLRDFLG
jgi:hypothetical protein